MLDGTKELSVVQNYDGKGDYGPMKLVDGKYRVTATPYSERDKRGVAGTEHAITFFVVSKSIPKNRPPTEPPALQSPPAVTQFVLVNADTDKDIGVLEDNAVILLRSLPTNNLNIRADTSGDNIGGIVFWLDGPNGKWTSMVQNTVPYAWFSDNDGNYKGGRLDIGTCTLSAAPFSETDGRSTAWFEKAITFSVTK